MRTSTLTKLFFCVGIISLTVGCGSSGVTGAVSSTGDSDTAESSAITAVADLPDSSGNVVSGETASSSLSKLVKFQSEEGGLDDADKEFFDEEFQDGLDDADDEFDHFEGDNFQEDDFADKDCEDCFNIDEFNEGSIPSTMSMGACKFVNDMKIMMAEAMRADLIKCYVTTMTDAYLDAVAAGDLDDAGIDLKDGQAHTVALDFTGVDALESEQPQEAGVSASQGEGEAGGSEEDVGPDLVQITLSRSSDDAYTGFSMRACKDGVQGEEVIQTIAYNSTTDTATVNSTAVYKNSYSFTDELSNQTFSDSFTDKVQVFGYLNADKNFVDSIGTTPTPKVIALSHKNDHTSGAFEGSSSGKLVGYQFDKILKISGFFSGSDQFNNFESGAPESCTFSDKSSSVADLLDSDELDEETNLLVKNTEGSGAGSGGKTKISDWKIGAGAAKMAMSGECGGQAWNTASFVEAWGNNLQRVEDASASKYFTLIDGETLKSEATTDADFAAEMNCEATADVTFRFSDFEDLDIFSSCSHLDGFAESGHINCFVALNGQDTIDEGNHVPEGDGIQGEGPINVADAAGNEGCGALTPESEINTDTINLMCKCFGATKEECAEVQANNCFDAATVEDCVGSVNEGDLVE